jgi:MFS family permease
MVTMTLVTVPLMDRVGRRLLHLLGLGGMFIMTILIIIAQESHLQPALVQLASHPPPFHV